MIDFDISIVVEHGYPHYKVVDIETGKAIHCDLNELDKTIDELSSISYLSYDKCNVKM